MNKALLVVATLVIASFSIASASSHSLKSVQLVANASAQTTSSTIQLPIEVIGPNGETTTVSFDLSPSQASSAASLWMQANNLSYADKASVQINGGPWIGLDNTSVHVAEPGQSFGGIGGGFSTLTVLLSLSSGSVVAGTNVISFRMNQTDGVSSGFRILNLNLVNSSGDALLPGSSFSSVDPNSWTPPLNTAADIAAGHSLWTSAHLVASSLPGARALQAHCADCHTQDGRDLKYFNFSNYSIIQRSQFHGLSANQGMQIASFIRSLQFPNPGRPWNPPYQPGPGLGSQPISNWAAGAGIGAVLAHDTDSIPYLFPNGINQAAVAATGWVDIHEIPVFLPLPSWNQWLPSIHPTDAFGAAFSGSPLATRYQSMQANLASNLASYISGQPPYLPSGFESDLTQWVADRNAFFSAYVPGWPGNVTSQASSNNVLQLAHWQLVKNWELMQHYGLEALIPPANGYRNDDRAWNSPLPFMTSTNRLQLPADGNSPFEDNVAKDTYFTNAWYYLQAVVHSGQRSRGSNDPIDWSYMYQQAGKMNWNGGGGNGVLFSIIFTRGMQENVTSAGLNNDYGWNPSWGANVQALVFPEFMIVGPGLWADVPPAVTSQIMTAIVGSWFQEVKLYTPAQYYGSQLYGESPLANPHDVPSDIYNSSNWGDRVYDMIPRFRDAGVDGNLLNSICDWAATVWPRGNWSALKQ